MEPELTVEAGTPESRELVIGVERAVRITIGDEVLIGPNVSLVTSGHPLDPATRRRVIVASPIVIERNVWVGAGATILGGVTVGADAVVAAGAVVTRDVPPATLVAGVPARIIRSI